MKRILFLTQGDEHVASSRHRVYQYLPQLIKAGFEPVVHPAVTSAEFAEVFLRRSLAGNLQRLWKTFTRRVHDLHEIRDYDYVFIQKPILPAPFFNIESKIARETKTIFDFDDAIHLNRVGGTPVSNLWAQAKRIAAICKSCHKVVVGNEVLGDFVRKLGVEPIILPTTVQTDDYSEVSKSKKRELKIPVIGWVGSPATQTDLKIVVKGLVELHSKAPFIVRIIGGKPESIPVRFPIEWKAWKLETAIADVGGLDYGLAPLMDNDWNRGKCGLKVLQYWAAGVPVIASPTGIYKDLIQERENGLFASTPSEWASQILDLMTDPMLYHKIVLGGRKKVVEKYSVQANFQTFSGLFEN